MGTRRAQESCADRLLNFFQVRKHWGRFTSPALRFVRLGGVIISSAKLAQARRRAIATAMITESGSSSFVASHRRRSLRPILLIEIQATAWPEFRRKRLVFNVGAPDAQPGCIHARCNTY